MMNNGESYIYAISKFIRSRSFFEKKLEYYRKTYNEDLVLKGNNGIEIVDFCCADDFEDIEHDLIYSYN